MKNRFQSLMANLMALIVGAGKDVREFFQNFFQPAYMGGYNDVPRGKITKDMTMKEKAALARFNSMKNWSVIPPYYGRTSSKGGRLIWNAANGPYIKSIHGPIGTPRPGQR